MITLRSGNSTLEVLPYRGAATGHWKVDGKDVLFIDEATFSQPQMKFVGGNPVMFPIFSTLGLNGEEALMVEGHRVELKQHGLARLSSHWRANQSAENQIQLYLNSNDESLEDFPWAFSMEMTYTLEDRQLTLEQKVTNIGEKILPFVAGFHPYFQVSDPRNCEVSGLIGPWPCYRVQNHGEDDYNSSLPARLPFGEEEVNHHVVQGARPLVLKDRLSGRHISIEGSGYPCTTVWSEPGRPFVCIEPTTGRRGAMQTREHLIRLEAQETWSGQVKIQVS